MSFSVRWRFLEPYQAVYRIGVDRRADGNAHLGISHASLEVAATGAQRPNAQRLSRRQIPAAVADVVVVAERLVDTVLRSAQSPEITALVYAAVFIPHHQRDHPEKCHPATQGGWQLVTPPPDCFLLSSNLAFPLPLVCDSALSCVC